MSSSELIPAGGPNRPAVSLVTTIRNEAESLPTLLDSLERQTLPPREVIVVDGGSTDGSLEVLLSWRGRLPLAVVSRPGANISQGRNAGISLASCDFVAVTDAGVLLDPDWLERLVAPLVQSVVPVDVSAGFFEPDTRNLFEDALAATSLPDVREIDPLNFLPSSRSVAFRKSWFDAGVRYPEWLDYCEDLVFDLRLQQAGARFRFQPDAIVRFRPRRSVRSFWTQYHHYARGDGKAGLFWRRHLARYLTYTVAVPLALPVRSWRLRLIVILAALAYMRAPMQRLWRRSDGDVGYVVRRTPVTTLLRLIGDFAKMAGYPEGLLWRARRYGLKHDWRSIPDE